MTEFYFTGNDLIEMGFKPGPNFGPLLKEMNQALQNTKGQGEAATDAAVLSVIERHKKRQEDEAAERAARVIPLLEEPANIIINITPETEEEQNNVAGVLAAMTLLAKTPIVEAVAIMPDACPAGSISVGGVAAARNAIVPEWHSADICCSMYATNLGKADPKTVLDSAFKNAHFGPGGRSREKEAKMPADLIEWLMNSGNRYVADKKPQAQARSHLMSSGDGLSYAA